MTASDLAICHVETPFSQPGHRTTFPHYYVHPNLAKAVAATGFRECSTASNWTADKGAEGAKRTVESLKAQGVGQSGIRIPASARPFTLRTVQTKVGKRTRGVKVAHLSHTDPNDSPAAADTSWAINRGSADEIIEQAKAARNQGAELVVVSLAMGAMGSDSTAEAQQLAAAKIAASDDVDLVIGHGSHTIQPPQKIGKTWVIWHGNLLSSFFPNQQNMHVGLLSQVKFRETTQGRFESVTATGYPMLSTPQNAHIVDMAAGQCARHASYWQHVNAIMSFALKQGFALGKPC